MFDKQLKTNLGSRLSLPYDTNADKKPSCR